jgi:hypothetical protein
MTQQEFTNRTQVEVSNSEFEMINEFYMSCECDKDEFCKMWVKMNPNRVKAAKDERKKNQRAQSYRQTLTNWFNKYRGTQYFYDNYNTNIAFTKISTNFVQALSFAGIRIEDYTTFSDIHFRVGQYLGIYRNL